MVTITKDVKNTEGGFVRVAVGVETLNRLKQLAGSSSLSGYLSGLTQELLKGEQTELLPRLKGQISMASLKLAIDDLAASIGRLEEIVTGIILPHYAEDAQSNTQNLFDPVRLSNGMPFVTGRGESVRNDMGRKDTEHRKDSA